MADKSAIKQVVGETVEETDVKSAVSAIALEDQRLQRKQYKDTTKHKKLQMFKEH